MNRRQRKEWESKCLRCGLCCHDRAELADAVVFFATHCEHLDPETKLCKVYEKRFTVKPDCIKLTPENVRRFRWLPRRCGLRRESFD